MREGDTLLIYSKPDTPKLRNIARAPRVALHFDGDKYGNDIIIFTGAAALEPQAPLIDAVPDYMQKYRQGIKSNGMTPESFAQTYSAALRVRIEAVRGH